MTLLWSNFDPVVLSVYTMAYGLKASSCHPVMQTIFASSIGAYIEPKSFTTSRWDDKTLFKNNHCCQVAYICAKLQSLVAFR